ncbi:malto-oligosyltrehalose trehalohydrolase [Pseudoroseomonas cervicalis]|uniref:malto-oligosyltrehalose trehalohydrolase n=1 Tax=Teichococcus cervicalis TaxID=204525 RepID=UPI0022F1D188|nr:malto-oligosyltrehalose trehalohydrolase [Pseudoroseomonas cervicalis]WBV41948.1 malto-oligosyltrehalose trehalohydrolase [Pseudoroseomonas cervicalis]
MSHAYAFGALPLAGGQTRFRLWAPGQPGVTLLRRDAPPLPMRPEPDAEGWWRLEAEAPPGTRYRYALGDGPTVPDPASHAQDGDVDGWSIVTDHAAHRWKHDDWRTHPWPQSVVYELHVGAMGGFRGVIAALPRLAQLGVNTIELMPVNDFSGARNWGYDGVLPYAPDEAYGTPEELKTLVDAAHGHGLAVMLDVVYNHFGPAGNYWHSIAPGFFRDDLSTPWGEAIDFRRDAVRDFFIENALFWLREYRFDGLRLDAVHAIASDSFLPELSQRVRGALSRPVYLVLENETNDATLLERHFDAQWNDDAHHCLHVLLTGESEAYYADYADRPAEHLARSLAEGFVYQGETSKNLGHARGKPSGHLPPSAFVNAVQNHDQVGNRAFGDRIATLASTDALRAAQLVQLLSPPVPMLFMGEEFASERPFLFFTGFPSPELADAVREGRRKEFAKFAAFQDPERRARIPDPNHPDTFEASRLDPAERTRPPKAEYEAFVSALLALRRDRLAHRLAGAQSLGARVLGPAAVQAEWRLADGAVLGIAVQFGDEALPLTLPPHARLAESAPGIADTVASAELPPRSAFAWLQEPAA